MTKYLNIGLENLNILRKRNLAFAAAFVVMALTIYPLASLAAGTSSSGGSSYSVPATSKTCGTL